MERNNNTYGELINNKFSDLLSVDMDTTWKGMKRLLDREMPENKKRKWLLWLTTNAGIIAIVLCFLSASVAGIYISFK